MRVHRKQYRPKGTREMSKREAKGMEGVRGAVEGVDDSGGSVSFG